MKKIIKILAIISIVFAGFLYIGNNSIQITNHVPSSDKIPKDFDNFKILQLSDLHSKEFGKDNRKLIQKVDKENPDIIVMTGDMVNTSDDDFDIFLNLAKELVQKYEIYFIVGNHEQIYNRHRLTQDLKDMGVIVLDNEKTEIVRGNSSISMYGLFFSLKYYKNANSPYEKDIYLDLATVQNEIGSPDPEEYNVLLTHNPLYFPTYSLWGADLTLAGHIHGGIIRIPFKGGLLSPERSFFPEYDAGVFNIAESAMIVNRGLGSEVSIPRVFNRPEITVITLKSQPRE